MLNGRWILNKSGFQKWQVLFLLRGYSPFKRNVTDNEFMTLFQILQINIVFRWRFLQGAPRSVLVKERWLIFEYLYRMLSLSLTTIDKLFSCFGNCNQTILMGRGGVIKISCRTHIRQIGIAALIKQIKSTRFVIWRRWMTQSLIVIVQILLIFYQVDWGRKRRNISTRYDRSFTHYQGCRIWISLINMRFNFICQFRLSSLVRNLSRWIVSAINYIMILKYMWNFGLFFFFRRILIDSRHYFWHFEDFSSIRRQWVILVSF